MSISGAIGSAMSGLTANARMAEIASENLSNSLTDGYGRREVSLSSARQGVRIDGIQRHGSSAIIADRRLADADSAALDRKVDVLAKLEGFLGASDEGDSISGRFASFEGKLLLAANNPSSEARLRDVNDSLISLVDAIKKDASQIQGLRQDADAAIARDVDALNIGLAQVERLNHDIGSAIANGSDTSHLMDDRQRAIDQISAIVPVREVSRGNGQIAILSTKGASLVDGRHSPVSFNSTATTVAEMTFESGALAGVVHKGDPLSLSNGYGHLEGGSLSASFELRDSILVSAQADLDRLSFDIANRLNGSTSALGLITDAGQPLDPADINGLSARIAVNPSVDPGQGGNLNTWRNGIGQTTPAALGDGSVLFELHDGLNGSTTDAVNTTQKNAAERIAAFTARVNVLRVNAEDELSFANSRHDSLTISEKSEGVDSDQELQKLLQIEQAYAANARVLQVINAMMQRLLEI